MIKRCACLILILTILLVVPHGLLAQTVTGKVVDAATKGNLAGVNITLYRMSDSSLVNGAVTGKDGSFLIPGIPAGTYFLRFSLISYTQEVVTPVHMGEPPQGVDIGRVLLREEPVRLNEVVVTGEKFLMTQGIDRKVYNVEKDVASASGSVSELLRNIPSVEVDIEGTVSLRGSTDLQILVNGKTSALMGRNQAEVLQQMPANAVERIEVITNPSARYRPDGTGGIINLVLKKEAEKGFNGSATASAGKDGRYGGNARLNVRPAETNFFGNYSLRNDVRNRADSDFRVQGVGATGAATYREDGSSTGSPQSHMAVLGIEHDFGTGTSVLLSGNYFVNQTSMTETAAMTVDDGGAASLSDRVTTEESSEEELGYRISAEHKFAEEGHEIRLEIQGSQEREEELTDMRTAYGGSVADGERIANVQVQNSTEITADYVNPMDGETRMEAGYGGEFSADESDARAELYDIPRNTYVPDISQSNHFVLQQALHAVYTTFRHSFGPLGVMAGIRGELVFRNSNLVTRGTEVQSDYAALYPSVHLSYRVAPSLEFQANYSRRTHRPHAHELNPFPEYNDPRNISSGNPRLLPEYINSVECGLKLEHEYFNLVPSVYYRYTTNRFTSVVRPLNDSTLLTTSENLADDRSAGVELVVSGGIREVFSLTASWNGFYNVIDASNLGYAATRSVWSWSGSVTGNVMFGSGTMVQINGNYRSARLTPQGSYAPSGIVNLGVRQDFWNRQLTATLTIADMFKTMRRQLNIDTPGLVQQTVSMRDGRVFVFSITFRFGSQGEEKEDETLRYDDGTE